MPVESAKAFGAKVTKRKFRKKEFDVVRFPVYDATGKQHSHTDICPYSNGTPGKGLLKPGRGTSGMHFPGRLPESGETWTIVEGVKDAAALHGLGLNAACLLYTSPSPRDQRGYRMPSSA